MIQKTLDLTRYEGICGDPLVYVVEEFESDPSLERLRVIHDDCNALREAMEILGRLGFKCAFKGSAGQGICVLEVERKD